MTTNSYYKTGIYSAAKTGVIDNSRNKSIDVARGLLMFYIITFVHGIYWLDIVGIASHSPVFASFFLFEMPCVFVVSGYTYSLFQRNNSTLLLRPINYARYMASRISRIYVPFLIYAVSCSIIVITFAPMINRPRGSAIDIILSWVNPIALGSSNSIGCLNFHLWFIPSFLMVTLLLPLLVAAGGAFSKITCCKIPLPIIAVLFSLTMYALPVLLHRTVLPQKSQEFIQTTAFYLSFAIFGYALDGRFKTKESDYLITFLCSALSLLFVKKIFPNITLNMQVNKFPPNSIFSLFSCAWVSLVLLICSRVHSQQIDTISSQRWLQPFIACGYSVYLWQGVGYSIALLFGKVVHLPKPAVWLTAILITCVVGLLMHPFERLRFRSRLKCK